MSRWHMLLKTILAAGFFASAVPSQAETWRLFEDTLELTKPADGDVFLLANEVTVSANVQEDAWVAGRKISVTGTIADDIRAAGLEVVTLDGTVEGTAHLVSSLGNVVVSTNAVVRADARLQAGKRISVQGKIEGDVWAQAPRVVVDGDISGSLTVDSPNIQFLPGAVIRGDLITFGNQPLPVPEGVTVGGERLQETRETSEMARQFQQLVWMIRGLQFITATLIGLAVLRMFPRFTGQNVELLMNRQAPLISIGLFSCLLMTLGGYFLLFTVIGTGIGLFLLLVTGLLFYLGKLFVAFLIGMLLLRQTTDLAFGKLALALLIGLTVLYTVSFIPYIGTSIYLLASCWGMGAMLVSLRLSQNAVRYHVPSSTTEKTP